jgi:hypothetical protein
MILEWHRLVRLDLLDVDTPARELELFSAQLAHDYDARAIAAGQEAAPQICV